MRCLLHRDEGARSFSVPLVPALEPRAPASEPRLHRGDRSALHRRDRLDRMTLDVEQHHCLPLHGGQRGQRARDAPGPHCHYGPIFPGLARRSVGVRERLLPGKKATPERSTMEGSVPVQQRGIEPGPEAGFVPKRVEFLVGPQHGVLIEVVTIRDRAAQTACRGDRLLVKRLEQRDQFAPSDFGLRLHVPRFKVRPFRGPNPETPGGHRKVAGDCSVCWAGPRRPRVARGAPAWKAGCARRLRAERQIAHSAPHV